MKRSSKCRRHTSQPCPRKNLSPGPPVVVLPVSCRSTRGGAAGPRAPCLAVCPAQRAGERTRGIAIIKDLDPADLSPFGAIHGPELASFYPAPHSSPPPSRSACCTRKGAMLLQGQTPVPAEAAALAPRHPSRQLTPHTPPHPAIHSLGLVVVNNIRMLVAVAALVRSMSRVCPHRCPPPAAQVHCPRCSSDHSPRRSLTGTTQMWCGLGELRRRAGV